MLMFDPFLRDFDRLTEQLLGTTTGTPARPAAMPMDAWRDGEKFVVELDLPGIKAESLDLNVEHDVLTVRAERPAGTDGSREWLAAERPHGLFSRQILLGTNVDTQNITADYTDGVLRLEIPVAEHAKPRKIAVATGKHQQAISA